MARRLLIAAGAAAVTLAAGCAQDIERATTMEMPWGHRVSFACMDGRAMDVEFVPSPRAARVTYGSTTVTLPQVGAASDAKFTDGRTILYLERPVAMLEVDHQVIRRACQPR